MYKKIDKSILFIVFLFMIISVCSIYMADLTSSTNYYIKQIIWYIVGFIITFLAIRIKRDRLYKNAYFFYILSNIILILLLILAKPINESKCWFQIKGIGTIQPSEFVKIALIILFSFECSKFKKTSIKDEFKFLVKIFILLLIPSFLTFMEPDTGAILIYIVITLSILFVSGIRYRWFTLLFIICTLFIGFILFIYFFYKDLFINIFGNSFFLRINRILDWSNSDGFQLTNSLTSIGSAKVFGHPFNNIYIPESQTDFVFSAYSSSFGFVGSILLITLILMFDLKIINIGIKAKKKMLINMS